MAATPRRPWTRHPKVVQLRTRSRLADAVVGTLDGFRVHQSTTGSTLVTYFGFISVFPLLLVFTTILGFVLQDDPELRQEIIDSTLSKLPLIGPQLASSPEALKGSVIALVVGLALALWSGTKAFVALQTALDNTNEVPLDERHNFVQVRVRALGGIVVIGLAQAGSAALSGVVTAAGLPALGNVGIVVGSALLNAAVLSFTYRWLTSDDSSFRSVLPGSLLAGALFSMLQVLGTTIIARSQANAESMYGDFTTTFVLLAWLSLHATVALIGAELNRALRTSPFWARDGRGAEPSPPETMSTGEIEQGDTEAGEIEQGDAGDGSTRDRRVLAATGARAGDTDGTSPDEARGTAAARVEQRGAGSAIVGLLVVSGLGWLTRLTGRPSDTSRHR